MTAGRCVWCGRYVGSVGENLGEALKRIGALATYWLSSDTVDDEDVCGGGRHDVDILDFEPAAALALNPDEPV